MVTPLDCPGLDRWQSVFNEALPPRQRELFERHLETCPVCQGRLDRATDGGDDLLQLARQVGDPTSVAPDQTLTRFLEHLHEGKSPLRTVPADPLDLYFLNPADQPGVLGTLGNYEVQEVIGQGGMGVVLKAYEPALHRLVAIKVMAPALAGSATARRRFTREAQAAAAVCHDHIVAVYGVYEQAGLPYLVMQYVAGESLQARLDRAGPLEVTEVVRIGLQTASALAAAHAQGLIHRDVKPANLLLENGVARVKITDFGLARMADDVALTQAGVVAGTPEYMAPEQARGEPVDHRADLFSLGSVLYAMCTGRPPFRGSTAMAVLRQVSDDQPPPVRSLNPEVPAWLESLIVRLMGKDPAQRFPGAAEVATLLESYLAHLRQPTTVAAPELVPPPAGTAAAPHRLRLNGRRLFSPAGALALALLLASLGLLALGVERAGQADVKRPAPIPAAVGGDVFSVAVSADGTVVAAGAGMWDKPGEVGVWNLARPEPLQRFPAELGVASVALSPTGTLLASGNWAGHVRVHDHKTGKEVFDLTVNGVARVAFSPDGRLLATASEDKTVQLWDAETSRLVADLEGDLFRFHCVAFSPDGQRVLAGGGDWKMGGVCQVNVWDVAERKQVMTLTGHRKAVLAICFSPDGKLIATGGVDAVIRLWDAATGKPLKNLAGHGGLVEGLDFSPDGKTLVSGSSDGTVRFWDVARGKETRRITLPVNVRSVRFTPDGERLLVGGGPKTLKAFATADLKESALLWDGSRPMPTPMDLLPVTEPGASGDRPWLRTLGLVALGLGFLVSLAFVVRRARRCRGDAPGETAPPVSFACAACGRKLTARAKLAGNKVKCPRCGQATLVPEAPATALLSRPRRWWLRPDVLAACTVPVLIAVLAAAGLWLSRGEEPPHVSRLQVMADRVRAQKTDIIDARPFPSVADRDLAALQGLTHLHDLNLDHSEVTDEGLKVIAGLENLVKLSLTNTQVTDAGLAELKPLARLEELRLDKLPITDGGLAHLAAFSGLRKLSLYRTKITDAGLAHLQGFTDLEHLSLDETSVGDEGLRHLSRCPNLKRLSVWRTNVTPAGLQELRKALPRLQINK